jgi:hypothetical protein
MKLILLLNSSPLSKALRTSGVSLGLSKDQSDLLAKVSTRAFAMPGTRDHQSVDSADHRQEEEERGKPFLLCLPPHPFLH